MLSPRGRGAGASALTPGQLLYAVRIPKALSLRPLSLAVHPAVRAGPGALPEFPVWGAVLCVLSGPAPAFGPHVWDIPQKLCFASITRPSPSSWAPPTPVSGGHSQGPSALPPPPARVTCQALIPSPRLRGSPRGPRESSAHAACRRAPTALSLGFWLSHLTGRRLLGAMMINGGKERETRPCSAVDMRCGPTCQCR